MDWKSFALTKPYSAYSIFCGVLEYPENILDEFKSGNKHGFEDWKIHVNLKGKTSEDIIKGFKSFYYESFVDSIFPDIDNHDNQHSNLDFTKKTIRLSRKIDQEQKITIRQGEAVKDFKIKFEYLDLFFFPGEIVFYCFKCDLTGFTFDEITLINSHLRDSGVTEDTLFLYEHLSFLNTPKDNKSNTNFLSFGNKLKVFLIVELDENLTEEEQVNMLLYDLGTCNRIGSAKGVYPDYKPSKEYYQELIEKNRISVYNNWTALSLFDTFTGLFQKGALNYFNWENGYFNLLYLHSLYVKNYLFKINRTFFNKGIDQQRLEDQFFEFNKYYNPSHISYNFLPPIIFKKIRYSLAINDELALLKERIERATLKYKEKRDKMINDMLKVIALLAVFSVIWDVSEWVNKLFSGSTFSYNLLSGSLTAIVLLTIGVFLIRNYKKRL